MSNAFLNALKQKSETVQSEMREAAKIGAWTGKSSIPEQAKAIEDLLNQPATKTLDQKFRDAGIPISTPAPMQNYEPNPIHVKIERVINRNRLDVYFSDIPSEEIRTALKDRGFHFDGDRKAWYHRDTILNRLFLSERFNAPELVDPSEIQSEVASDMDRRVEADLTPETSEDSECSEEYRKFKTQVNALQKELSLDAADLMLKAIDCLYNFTFKVN